MRQYRIRYLIPLNCGSPENIWLSYTKGGSNIHLMDVYRALHEITDPIDLIIEELC